MHQNSILFSVLLIFLSYGIKSIQTLIWLQSNAFFIDMHFKLLFFYFYFFIYQIDIISTVGGHISYI